MTTTETADLIRQFDEARSVEGEARNRRVRSSHHRDLSARAVSNAFRLAVAATLVAVVASAAIAFVF